VGLVINSLPILNDRRLALVQATSLRFDKEICPGYRLGRLRGRGGFGSVWEAKRPGGAIVALKFLPCSDKLAAAQEIRSIQIVRQLRHPNLVRIEEVWCHRGYVVVTMELGDGSLLDLLDAYQTEFGTGLCGRDICFYLEQVATALDFLNCRQHQIEGARVAVQHCDIKPTNILLFGDRVKISDFGLSSLSSSPIKSHRRAGTAGYAAPEVFQGRLSDWSDQYSLAVTYCHLRAGRLPFADVPNSFREGPVRPAPDLSILPDPERAVLQRALAPAPGDRWPTCRDFIRQLTQLQ
jgi:serine/threonine protein kinase, bacterial